MPFYGWGLSINEALAGGFGNGPDQTITTPTRSSPYTWYWVTADSSTSLNNRKPLVVVSSVPVGSGLTPRRGTYANVGGQWLPLDDDTGVPFDPQTGEDLPGLYKDGFEVANPFTDRAFEFDLVMTDPQTGEVISEGAYTLGPGATMPFDLVADRPYDWAVYPRVDGVRSPTPYQSGSGAYGGTGSSGSSGSPGTVGGPPLMHGSSPTTAGNTPQATAPTGDVQAEIKRLADLMQQTEDAQRTNANLQFDQLTKLNATASGSKAELGEIRETIEQGNGILAAIEANTGATAENTEGGAGTGGMTQSQFEESLDGSGLVVDPLTSGSDADGVALVNAVLGLKTSLESLADSVTINTPSGSSSLAFAIPTPAGTVSVDLEPYSTWFSIVRAVFLFLAVLWFFNAMTETLRSAVS